MTPTIWKFIRRLAKERGMTMVKLSAASGVTYDTIRRSTGEQAKKNSIHMEDYFSLCSVLGIGPAELMDMYAKAVGRPKHDER